jgi:hypothetical protein
MTHYTFRTRLRAAEPQPRAPLLAPASRAGRDLALCKQSPDVLERKRKALARHLDSFGAFKRGKL